MQAIHNTKGVHPKVLRRMRDYAIRQAISELNENPKPKDMERVAKTHMLSYAELKEAYYPEHPRQ